MLPFPPLRLFLALGALVTALDAAALTLGRARGAVLIGRPLELSIPATLDVTDSDPPCVEGDVFHGEQRVDSRLSIRWVPGEGRQGQVRVTSGVPVDEPMVTVYLRVGCGSNRSTRRYVLLSEPPPEQEPAAPLVAQPSRMAAPAPRAAEAERPPAARPPAAEGPPPVAARAEPAPRLSPASRLGPRRAAGGERTPRDQRPRLRLEAPDVPEQDPSLRLSPALPAAPQADERTRQAAAALWSALSRPPEASAQEAQRLQTLERELQSLRDATRQNTAALAAMQGQVEKARDERNFLTWVGLGLLALLLLAAALLLRGRREGGRRWYAADGPDSQPPQLRPLDSAVAPASPALAAHVAATAPRPTAPPPRNSGFDSVYPAAEDEEDERAAALRPGRPSRPPHSDFQPSMGGSIRMVRVDELIDIQDKAEFFLSLGQHEQAIAVLESHVHDQVETSAVAWLDLLALYHRLGRQADFDRLRSEFRQHFNANVPEFDDFDQPTGGLEKYGRALSRIAALWPSPRVLEVIEESIFRKPGIAGAEAFSLEAYRELILLYNIAKDVVPGVDSEGGFEVHTAFPSTDLQPLAPWVAAEEADAREALLVPPASHNVGLDINLDEPEPDADDLIPPTGRRPAGTPEPSFSSFGSMLDFDTSFGEVDPPKGRPR